MNCLAKFCVSLALLEAADGLASAFASQTASASSTRRLKAEQLYRQRVWTRENGLPDNRILSLLQTQDGHLWVGTPRGLARFDGLTFEVITSDTVAEFVSEECAALAEDADSTLWIGTPAGLIHLAPDRIERFTTADGLVNDRIMSLCRARNGDLWIGTASGLTRRRAGVFETVLPVSADTIAEPQVLVVPALYEDAAGSVWLGGMESVRRWDPATDRFSPVTLPPRHPQLAMQIAGNARTNVWLRGIGLFHCLPNRTITVALDRQEVSRYYEPLRALENVRALLVDRDGNAWLGWEQSGLTRLSGGQQSQFGVEDGLSSGSINCLLEDLEGNLWIGTDGGGLNCWQPRRFAAYGSADGLPDNDIRVVYPARDGGIWIGTERGVALWRDGLVIRRPIGPNLYDRRVRSIHEDPDGALWIGTMDSLERWQEGQRVAYRWSERPDGNRIRVIKADRTGTLWVGHAQGLARWSEGRFALYSTADGLPHNEVRAILEDRGGRLWLGTFGGGLCSVDRTPKLRIQSLLSVGDGLSDNHVCVLYEDSQGVLWAGTPNGLNRIEFASASPHTRNTSPTIAVFNRTNGLPDDVVNAIVEDNLGHLWIGCERGICRVAIDQFEAVASGRAPRVQCVVYDESDGLPSSEVKGQNSHPAACKTEDGRLWFATAKGAVVFDPARVIQEDLAPLVQIDRVAVGNPNSIRNVNVSNARDALPIVASHGHPVFPFLTFSNPDRRRSPTAWIEVHYAAPTFRAPEDVRFRYRLEGWDSDWVDAHGDRTARYPSLRPGSYRFQVVAASNFSLWSPVPAELTFAVVIPFYQTRWFWPACAAAFILLAGTGVFAHYRELKRMHAAERQSALAIERERIARDMHDDLGARLNQLALLSDFGDNRAGGETVAALAREAARSLDEIVWAMQPGKDTLNHLMSYLIQRAREYLAAAGVDLVLELPTEIPAWPLNASQRKNVFLACKEALHNAVMHAKADTIRLTLRLSASTATIGVSDDGIGFDPSESSTVGNGLSNMRSRIEEAQGEFRISSSPQAGTTVLFTLPRFGAAESATHGAH